jgi:ABC-type Fe3+/spermidine/putrescine transport system ATPase subunit
MTPKTPAVEFVEVSRHFDRFAALDRISLTIEDGEFFAMLGPSGSGKTTSLRLIAGFDRPTAGRIMLHGADVGALPPYRRDVNTVFQDYALFPHMNVADNVGYGPMVRGAPAAERQRQVEEMLALVQLADFGARKPAQLSGGQRQRVALARALINHPRILLLDEPLGALDLKLREQMQLELKAIQRRIGITFVYVTHDQGEALSMGDRIAVFNQGRIEQLGAPLDLYNSPANEFAAGFLGSPRINLVDRPGDGASGPHRALWDLLAKAAPEAAERMGLRAEHLRVVQDEQAIAATVVLAEHLGDASVLHLRLEGLSGLLRAKVGAGHEQIEAGQVVRLAADAAGALAFDAAGRRLG